MTDPTSPSDIPAEYDVPSRQDFRAARRRLMAALVMSIAIPLAGAVVYGYVTYQRALIEKQEALERFAWIAESNLAHMLDLNREVVMRIEDIVGTSDEAEIRGDETELHDRLRALVPKHPFVEALSVVGRNGELLVTSKFAPVPAVSIGDRDDFRATRDTLAPLHVSLPERGRVHGVDIVNELVPRMDEDGRFMGAVVVSIRRAHLLDFYEQLRARNPGLTLGLYRQDGGVLARVPPPKIANAPDRHLPLATVFAQSANDGFMRIASPMDGGKSMMAYRRAGEFPVYVSAGYSMNYVVHSWLREDMSVVFITLAPCACLCFLILFSLKRLKAEEAAWLSWRRESGKRQRAEDAARHLQRMGALANLVASVAHDFNNLLMVVTANMEMVRRKNYRDVQNEVNAVERASMNARVLARRLMSVARKQPLQQTVVQPNRWFEQTEPLIRSALSSQVTLKVRISDSLWSVKIDPVELTSALVNIAVNAKDAMPQGGEFHISLQNIVFESKNYGLATGDYVVIESRDTGTGMTDEVSRHAFEPLFTTKPVGKGTGLGLAQVLALAEQAGGTARLESSVGNGTTVLLYLPRSIEHEVPAIDAATTPEPARRDEAATVLLVEDNEEVAAGLVAVLDVLGWQARHEPTGDAALKVLEEGSQFDLVLSDIQMPGAIDGIGLAEWIRKQRPRQPITLMTGYADHLAEARRLGVSVLSKPFNADDLNALLSGVPMQAAARC